MKSCRAILLASLSFIGCDGDAAKGTSVDLGGRTDVAMVNSPTFDLSVADRPRDQAPDDLAAADLITVMTSRDASVIDFSDADRAISDMAEGDAHIHSSSPCGDTSGLQAGAPWPMLGGCPTRTGRSAYSGHATAQQKWAFNVDAQGGNFSGSTDPIIALDGTVYVGSSDNNLYALNPNGTVKWKFATQGWVTVAPTIGADGTLYVGSEDRNLYAVNPNGTQRWKFPTGNAVQASPVVGADGTIYLAGQDGVFYAIDDDGSTKWTIVEPGSVLGNPSPAIGSDGTIYIAANNAASTTLTAATADGTVKMTFHQPYAPISHLVVGPGDTIYMVLDDYQLHALSTGSSFAAKWKFGTKGHMDAPTVAADGTIYSGSTDGHLYALNPDGSMKWSVLMAVNSGDSYAPVIGADGTIYVVSNFLYAISPSGTVRWQTPSSGSSPAIATDGTIYTSNFGNVVAIGP